MACNTLNFKRHDDRFVGCDGKAWSDEFILFHIKLAVEEERYEWAQECKEELDKRNENK